MMVYKSETNIIWTQQLEDHCKTVPLQKPNSLLVFGTRTTDTKDDQIGTCDGCRIKSKIIIDTNKDCSLVVKDLSMESNSNIASTNIKLSDLCGGFGNNQ